jgi:hypothetical protein
VTSVLNFQLVVNPGEVAPTTSADRVLKVVGFTGTAEETFTKFAEASKTTHKLGVVSDFVNLNVSQLVTH